MFGILLFAFFFFLGFLAMFIYSERRRESLVRSLSDDHAQLRVLMRAMESRLDHLECGEMSCKEQGADENTQMTVQMEKDTAAHDPLLHLSFEEPGQPPLDPLLQLADEPTFSETGQKRA